MPCNNRMHAACTAHTVGDAPTALHTIHQRSAYSTPTADDALAAQCAQLARGTRALEGPRTPHSRRALWQRMGVDPTRLTQMWITAA
jgi:hypothetical protein